MKRMWIALQIVASFCRLISGEIQPFVTAPNSDLDSYNTFTSHESSNYVTLTLASDSQTLYIGGRDKVFVQQSSDITKEAVSAITWPILKDDFCSSLPQSDGGKKCQNLIQIVQPLNDTHLMICGTNFLSPKNKLLVKRNGQYEFGDQTRESDLLCSYDPNDSVTSLMLSGQKGPSIFSTARSLQSKISLVKKMPTTYLIANEKMESDETSFVSSFPAEDTVASPTMPKVYVVSDEQLDDAGKPTPSPTVTQVCANDIGGENVLSNKWTSLLKVRLRCETTDKYPLEFDLITDMVPGREGIVYGTFTTRHDTSRSNAVCAFRLFDIQTAFNGGNFFDKSAEPPTGEFYPGMCAYPGMSGDGPSTSKDFPTSLLSFMSKYNMIEDVVKPAYPPSENGSADPISRAPLFIKLGKKFTKIAVEQVTDLDGSIHDVIFVAKESGHVHKFLSIVKGTLLETIELAQYRPTTNAIISMKHSQKLGQLYVGTDNGVHQLSTSNCASYTKSCEFCDHCSMCILSRDPSCAWDSSTEQCVSIKNRSRDNLLQDVYHGNAVTLCGKLDPKSSGLMRVADGASKVLGKVLENPTIKATWYKVKDKSTKEKIHNKDGKYRVTTDGQLEISSFDSSKDFGTYECQYSANASTVKILSFDVQPMSYSTLTPAITEPPPDEGNGGDTEDDTTGDSRTGVTDMPETTSAAAVPFTASVMSIGLGVALTIIVLVAVILLVLFCRRQKKIYSPGHPSENDKLDVVPDSNGTPPTENVTNNNNARIDRGFSQYDDRSNRPLLASQEHQQPGFSDVDIENNHDDRPSSSQARYAKSLDNILDGREDEIHYADEDAASDDGVTRQSSMREKMGRTRVPPQRTKSMPGSALYVVYAGKKLKCSTLQRTKEGTWTVHVQPDQSGMSDMSPGQDEIIDILDDDTSEFLPSPDGNSANDTKIFTTPNPATEMKDARRAFFDGSGKKPGNDSSTVQYMTSTPNHTQVSIKPKVAPKPARLMSDRRKPPVKEQLSLGHNSSEERDSDSTVKGSSITLKPEETPPLIPNSLTSPVGQVSAHKHRHHTHHNAQEEVATEVPKKELNFNVPTPVQSNKKKRNKPQKIAKSTPQHANANSFNSSTKSLDRSSGSSDGDEHLHGRDKDVKRKNRNTPLDSPSKQSRTSQGSSSSGDYRSARSSVISEPSHEQR